MEIKDILFKIRRNIIPTLRGCSKLLASIPYSNIKIGKGIRIGRNTDWIFHPGCNCIIKSGLKCGKNTTISVLNKGRLEIGENVGIGNFNQIMCHYKISIGDETLLGPNVMIFDHNHLYSLKTGVDRSNYKVSGVTIGKNCWIGAGAIILKGVNIGDNSIIGAGSIVTKDIPENCVAAGSPAKIIKSIV